MTQQQLKLGFRPTNLKTLIQNAFLYDFPYFFSEVHLN